MSISFIKFVTMKPKSMLLAAILGLAAWWGWKKYVLLQSVKIDIGKVKLDGGLLNPRISIDLKVYNPTKLLAKVTNLQGIILDSSKTQIGVLSINGVYNIDANSLVIIPLNIVTDTNNILNAISQFLYNKMQNIEIKGTMTVDSIPVPFSFNYDI
jgi:hypothetical protein